MYNALGLATSVSVGTSDGTLWPGESSAPASNMVKVSAEAYNADGLLEMSVAENLNPQGLSTPVDSGTVTVDSSTTGSGYLMYRRQSVQSRFGASGSSGSFIAVACVSGQWEYDNGSGLAPSARCRPTCWWPASISTRSQRPLFSIPRALATASRSATALALLRTASRSAATRPTEHARSRARPLPLSRTLPAGLHSTGMTGATGKPTWSTRPTRRATSPTR